MISTQKEIAQGVMIAAAAASGVFLWHDAAGRRETVVQGVRQTAFPGAAISGTDLERFRKELDALRARIRREKSLDPAGLPSPADASGLTEDQRKQVRTLTQEALGQVEGVRNISAGISRHLEIRKRYEDFVSSLERPGEVAGALQVTPDARSLAFFLDLGQSQRGRVERILDDEKRKLGTLLRPLVPQDPGQDLFHWYATIAQKTHVREFTKIEGEREKRLKEILTPQQWKKYKNPFWTEMLEDEENSGERKAGQ